MHARVNANVSLFVSPYFGSRLFPRFPSIGDSFSMVVVRGIHGGRIAESPVGIVERQGCCIDREGSSSPAYHRRPHPRGLTRARVGRSDGARW